MKETDLHTRVLIPLFRQMGYRDVVSQHGLSLESGKDLVMWKPSDIRPRVITEL
jgi:hypothetical protein